MKRGEKNEKWKINITKNIIITDNENKKNAKQDKSDKNELMGKKREMENKNKKNMRITNNENK